jgi:hypothetical protein
VNVATSVRVDVIRVVVVVAVVSIVVDERML